MTASKYRFIHCFQNHSENFLNQLICKSGQAQRTLLAAAVPFINVCAANRSGLIAPVLQTFDDTRDLRFAEPVCRIIFVYVHGVIAHCLFEDRDKTDFLFSDGTLFTFDFAEGFRSSDFTIMVMEHQEQLSHLFSKDLVAQLATSSLDYYPSTLAAYELLVIDQQVCDKAFFDAALDDMCSRFLSIPNEEVESMLEALGAQYPAALIDHFKLYIDKIREFCQK